MSVWNGVLWRRSWADAKWLTIGCGALLFGFAWLFVWLTSNIEPGILGGLLRSFSFLERLSPIPFTKMTTPAGLVSVIYVEPIVIFTCILWAVARGSDVISGEIGRGTMEMLLAQPIRRLSIVVTHAVNMLAGSVVLVLCVWLGNCMGLWLVHLREPVSPRIYVASAVNLFGLTFCFAGVATLCSSWDRFRWRTIGLAGGFCLVQLILKVIARMWPAGGWIRYLTVIGAFEPQSFVFMTDGIGRLALEYTGVLAGIGTLAFIAAALIFCHRDLPAPL